MIYKIIAYITLFSITIIPLAAIIYFSYIYSWLLLLLIPIHFYLFKKFIDWAKSVDTSEPGDHTDGTRAIIGTKEKIVTVLKKEQ